MSFSEDIKKEWKKYLVGLVMLAVVGFGDKIIDIFNVGAEVEFNQKIQEGVVKALQNEEIIKELITNPRFVQLILASEEVKKFENEVGMKLRDEIIESVTKSDTNKISSRSFVAKELGIRDEAYFPLLVKALKAVKDEENASKKDVSTIIKQEVKSTARKPAVF
jgi:hypothetical protein